MKLRRAIATGLIAAMPLTLAACADSDDDASSDAGVEQSDDMSDTTDTIMDETGTTVTDG